MAQYSLYMLRKYKILKSTLLLTTQPIKPMKTSASSPSKSNDDAFVLRGISSMATKSILSTLTGAYEEATGISVHIESVGGVDAATRVKNGEAFDVIILASDAIDRLTTAGHIQINSRHDWALSSIAIAVKAGTPQPSIIDEKSFKVAVLASPTISYSTGPSGVYLEKLFESWGEAGNIKSRIVVPPPGTPVGQLVANGEASLGFQQLSELINLSGIDIVGTLPNDISYITTFSAGISNLIGEDKKRTEAVKSFLEFLSSEKVESIKHQQGMSFLKGLNTIKTI